MEEGFHVQELDRALREQQFGVISSRIDWETCTTDSAFASIYLLEQWEVRVKLSKKGYEMVDVNMDSEYNESPVFETLDDLLLALSPKYKERHIEELIARLSQLEDPSS